MPEGDFGIAEFAANRTQRRERALFVRAHQPRIAGNIDRQNRRQSSLDPVWSEAHGRDASAISPFTIAPGGVGASRFAAFDKGVPRFYSPRVARPANSKPNTQGGAKMPARFSPSWPALLGAAVLLAGSIGSANAGDVIKFGISTPLSGPAAPWGIPHKNAIELIFDEANAQGGLDVGGKKYKIEIVA